ncbi:hypothetical protein SARC_04642 [Sphaeroforma arctica JP610]|uniref:Checkpoint protein n=1 Tax=Sphaeroforma arctica JP610 TaxID=667725 RepID=A0A0L0G1T6_9EUKA|nr:hypothetical protein SARC_04642 [Sphaeroforma arctica JP610]KNC83082.1 hypothetical protein SARC_04642 [Sphaeroforma arctica JP610]|eukprot:XP_014156984.1 hypothetical protein SARC_04642 [Sphaeroforma arctica JP610]
MRFKATIRADSQVQRFTRFITTISRINKDATLRMAPGKLYFILVASDVSDGSVRVWAEVEAETIFDSFQIESRHPNNEILMEIGLENLQRALRSASASNDVVFRLTGDGGQPALTLTIKLESRTAERTVIQNVPVALLSHELTANYCEPDLPQPDINICLPSLKILSTIIDRMKTLDKYVVLSANNEGELRLQIEADAVSVCTSVTECEIPKSTDAEEQTRADDVFVSARIDIKKFSQFLVGFQMSPTAVICSIVPHRAVILFLLSHEVSMTYYVPVIS